MSSWATRGSFQPSGGPNPSWESRQARIQTDKVAVRARAKQPSGKPLARMPTPRIAYHAKTKGMAESLVKRLTGVSELFGGRLNRQQKNALHTMHGLLGPDKFGGKDRTFHYGDREAIVNSLMKDKPGLSKLTSKRLSRDGKNFRAGLVEKAFSDRLAFIGGAVKNRVKK